MKRIGTDKEDQGNDFIEGEEYSAPEETEPEKEDGDANAADTQAR